jgi:XRE family transcriptional regulator, regulator of sulfur utilization
MATVVGDEPALWRVREWRILPVLKTTVFDWDSMPVERSAVRTVRPVFRGATATLPELELHVTTLNPGLASHEPYQHGNEEVIILKEGTVEWYAAGQWQRVSPGSFVFAAANELHGIRNVGATPATYHVVSWTSPRPCDAAPGS